MNGIRVQIATLLVAATALCGAACGGDRAKGTQLPSDVAAPGAAAVAGLTPVAGLPPLAFELPKSASVEFVGLGEQSLLYVQGSLATGDLGAAGQELRDALSHAGFGPSSTKGAMIEAESEVLKVTVLLRRHTGLADHLSFDIVQVPK